MQVKRPLCATMADKKNREGGEVGDSLGGESELELDYDMEEVEVGETGASREVEKTEEVVRRVLEEKLAGCMDVFMEKMLSRMAAATGGPATATTSTGAAGASSQVTGQVIKEARATPEAPETGRRRGDLMEVGAIVGEFDPDDRYSNVNKFLGLIDQLGDVHGWSEYERSYLMQVKLRGASRNWFRRLDALNYSWGQWKENLRKAFPRQHDFHDCLAEMMGRKKQMGETMTSYFHAKLALCERVKVVGEDAVSCIIKGLPEELWANAWACRSKTPEALYSDFLSGLEHYRSPASVVMARRLEPSTSGTRPKRVSSPGVYPPKRQATTVEVKEKVRCYNCQEYGTHFSRDCPHPQKSRCSWCGGEGHWFSQCPKRKDYVRRKGGEVREEGEGKKTGPVKVRLVSINLDDTYKKIGVVGDNRIKVYIDTGCQHNLMTGECADRLGLQVIPNSVFLQGFGGGLGAAHGYVECSVEIDGVILNITALVTLCDISKADLILGQPAIGERGVAMVVRGGKATFVKEAGVEDPFQDLSIVDDEETDRRYLITLDEDIILEAGVGKQVGIHVVGAQEGDEVFIEAKLFEADGCTVAMPSGVVRGSGEKIMVTNLGPLQLRWKKGRVVARAVRCGEAIRQGSKKGKKDLKVSHVQSINPVELNVGDIGEDDRAKLVELLSRKAHCFSTGEGDLGLTHLGEMRIKLAKDAPVYYRPYRLSNSERCKVREKVQGLLDSGVIRESESAYASPIILVSKKDGGARLCVDYRALNAITVKDRYPLPLIADQLDRLAGRCLFTTLDMAQGYHQVPMHPDSIDKTAFITPDGQYEYRRVPFGLANSPAVFQRIINKMLGGLRHEQVLAYMDDLLIPSETVEGGLSLLGQVLDLIGEAGFKLNVSKCSFLKTSIEYLGHEVSGQGIRPGSRKVKAVADFPVPTDVHKVRQFIGLASYFRKFVKNFAVLARPLTQLTMKGVEWRWGENEQVAFEKLKFLLVERPILGLYRSDLPTELHTDASKLGLGGILFQRQPTGDLQVISYFSRATTRAEALYHSYELETLALVESVRRFRVYLLGVHFKVVTDCSAVRATLLKRDLVPRIARWWLAIQEYDMEVEYRPGDRMRHVDALSRNPVQVNLVSMGEADWFGLVQLQDEKVQTIVKALEGGKPDKDLQTAFRVRDGRLWRITQEGDRLYVPAIAKFSLLRKHHDDIGHPGFERCLELLRKTYWFPKMRRFVRKYTAACLNCAYAKGAHGRGEGFLHPYEKKAVPLDTVHIDHLGPFVKSVKRNSYLLVVVDAFTKYTWAKPTRTLSSAEAIEKLRWVFGEFGYPRRIISDRGLAFTSKAFASFLGDRGIKHVENAIATPRANGQVERANRTIIEAISASAEGEARWDEQLPEILWGLNHTINASTRFSPADLLFSYQGGRVADLSAGEATSATEGRKRLHADRCKAGERLQKAASQMKVRYDKRRKVATKYRVGDLVLWRQAATMLGEKGVNRKVSNKYDGPYKVSKVLGNDRYEIVSLQSVRGYKRFKAVVAVDALRRYQSGAINVGDESDDSLSDHDRDQSGRQDLIDLLES